MSDTYNPSIEQSLFQSWENNFILLAQNRRSVLSTSKAVKDFSFAGNKHNFGRMGKVGLTELSGRNPTVNWQDWAVDNRQALKRSFAIPIILDTKDLREAMTDPTSDIYVNIVNAFNRRKDKLIAETALAPVMVGDPNSGTPLASLTATQDGVISTDAIGGLTYCTSQLIR